MNSTAFKTTLFAAAAAIGLGGAALAQQAAPEPDQAQQNLQQSGTGQPQAPQANVPETTVQTPGLSGQTTMGSEGPQVTIQQGAQQDTQTGNMQMQSEGEPADVQSQAQSEPMNRSTESFGGYSKGRSVSSSTSVMPSQTAEIDTTAEPTMDQERNDMRFNREPPADQTAEDRLEADPVPDEEVDTYTGATEQ